MMMSITFCEKTRGVAILWSVSKESQRGTLSQCPQPETDQPVECKSFSQMELRNSFRQESKA